MLSRLRAYWYRLVRKHICSRIHHKWLLSKQGVSYCARCRIMLR